MPATANFVDTKLTPVYLSAEKIWRDPSLYAHLKRQMPTLSSIAENQTVRFDSQMFDVKKQCRTFIMHWLEDTTSGLVDSDALACTLPTGPKATSAVKTYTASQYKGSKFSIDELECNHVNYEEVLAMKLLKAKSELRAHLNSQAILFLNANASTANAYTTGGTFATNKTTYIPATWANLDLIMYYISRVAEMNDITNPTLINGENLNQVAWTAKYKQVGNNSTDQQAMLDTFGRVLWDARYLEAALTNEKASFLFDSNRVAILNDWKYTNTDAQEIDKKNNTEAFSLTDDMISIRNGASTMPIHYDVLRQSECYVDATTKVLRQRWNYLVSVRWEFVLAPQQVAANTGIQKLVNA